MLIRSGPIITSLTFQLYYQFLTLQVYMLCFSLAHNQDLSITESSRDVCTSKSDFT